MSRAGAEDLVRGYEALRSQATGGLVVESPCGMAVMVSQGVPSWIRAGVLPSSVTAAPVAPAPSSVPGLGGDVVRLLTEMVLGGGRRLAVS